jgi:hypothetical protein
MWLCLNEPKTYAGLLVRIMPYYIASLDFHGTKFRLAAVAGARVRMERFVRRFPAIGESTPSLFRSYSRMSWIGF